MHSAIENHKQAWDGSINVGYVVCILVQIVIRVRLHNEKENSNIFSKQGDHLFYGYSSLAYIEREVVGGENKDSSSLYFNSMFF